jgi:hypothetical protein
MRECLTSRKICGVTENGFVLWTGLCSESSPGKSAATFEYWTLDAAMGRNLQFH